MNFAARRSNTVILRQPRPNLASALEQATLAASGDQLLFMDSDCRFAPGTLATFTRVYEHAEVIKGRIIFEADSRVSRVIARTREHHTGDVLTAYKPPLLVHASIRKRIGGYFFDGRLRWREDSDLDARIRRAGIPIRAEPTALIYHPPLTLWEDLRSAFRYGVGLARARHHGVELTEVPRSVRSTLLAKGATPALYMVVRNTVYHTGTLTQGVRLRVRGARV